MSSEQQNLSAPTEPRKERAPSRAVPQKILNVVISPDSSSNAAPTPTPPPPTISLDTPVAEKSPGGGRQKPAKVLNVNIVPDSIETQSSTSTPSRDSPSAGCGTSPLPRRKNPEPPPTLSVMSGEVLVSMPDLNATTKPPENNPPPAGRSKTVEEPDPSDCEEKDDLRSFARASHMRWFAKKDEISKTACIPSSKEDFEGELLCLAMSQLQKPLLNAQVSDSICKILHEIRTSRLDPSLLYTSDDGVEFLDLSQVEPLIVKEMKLIKNIPEAVLGIDTTGPRYQVWAASKQGQRSYLEDRYTILYHLNELMGLDKSKHPQSQLFFGVYDGHNGLAAAHYCAAQFHERLVHHPKFVEEPQQALFDVFEALDKQFCEKAMAMGVEAGTTAVVALIRGSTLFFANCGDSRGFLIRGGKPVELSHPHAASSDDEKQRIKQAGGIVVWFNGWRVNGKVTVSRSIGDAALRNLVVATPYVMQDALTDEDEYLVMATDGLFDVMTLDEVANFVLEWKGKAGTGAKKEKENKEPGGGGGGGLRLPPPGGPAAHLWRSPTAVPGTVNAAALYSVADALVDEALNRQSKDNITAIVVQLGNKKPKK